MGASHKCVDDPATLHNYCGASWGDASKCTHGHCHNDDECPKDAPTCFASVTCPAPTPTPPAPTPPAPTPPVPVPKNCGTHGSTTSCPALDSKAYCGQSSDAKARFSDGTGCSCDTGYQYDAASHKCVDDPATLHNYCGASWGDASKCTHGHCHNDDECPKDASTCFASVTCPAPTPTPPAPTPPAPTPPVPVPKNCGTHGSTTSCPALDSKAYCGQSSDAKVRFSDGTGCSCDTGYQY